jgi:hypothetical protein
MDESQQKPAPPQSESSVPIHMGHSPQFRRVVAQAAWFGYDMKGTLHFSFYNDYFPVPKELLATKGKNGEGKMEIIKMPEGVIREIEVDVAMSLEAAEAFCKTLSQNIDNYREKLKT